MQEAEENLTRAREEEENPSDESNIHLKEANAKFPKTKLEATRSSWTEKTSTLDMEKEGGKVWRLTKAMNEEETKGAKVTLEDEEGNMCTRKKAGNLFSKSYAKES